MAAVRKRIGARIAREDGYSLPELMVALMISLLVAAGGMLILQIVVRSQPESSARAAQIQQGRAMLEVLTRELRQGESVDLATTQELTVSTYARSAGCEWSAAERTPCTVTYTCADGTCSRLTQDGPGGGTAEIVVSGLARDDVFRYCEAGQLADCGEAAPSAVNPGYIEIELTYPRVDGAEAVTFRDGVYLRNLIEKDPEAPPA